MIHWVYIGNGKKGHAIEVNSGGQVTIKKYSVAKCGILGTARESLYEFPEYGKKGKCEKCKARLESEK